MVLLVASGLALFAPVRATVEQRTRRRSTLKCGSSLAFVIVLAWTGEIALAIGMGVSLILAAGTRPAVGRANREGVEQ
ncbi:hypothetical protein LGM46_29425 [Burkholderia arboris]|uniref:hypothetical protein n=1 Tax=Burkholderia arboris TaxID=488730 RepID=UPI001CF4FB2D|nr:hypothetical protein [Burkholderia arboris]MCA8037091.1 hypothetical protein [Burkholderia arboris]